MSGKYKYNNQQLKVKQKARVRRMQSKATKKHISVDVYIKDVAFTQVQLRKN